MDLIKKKQQNVDEDWRPDTLTDVRARLDKNQFPTFNNLYEDLQLCLLTFTKGINISEAAFKRAKRTLELLDTLVNNCKVFNEEQDDGEKNNE
jgi:hypothetical protein